MRGQNKPSGSQRRAKNPLTLWETYQKKQAKKKPRPQPAVNLPQVAQLRKQKRRRNVLLLLTPFLVLLLVMGYMISPLSKVQEITVTGTQNVAIQTVIDASKLSNRDSMLTVVAGGKRRTAALKKQLPELKRATMRASGLTSVTIHVTEYAPSAYVLNQGRYHLLLSNGAMMSGSTKTPQQNLPVLTGFSKAEAAQLAQVVATFPVAVRAATSEVTATRGAKNPFQITLTMTDGNTVVADSRTVAKKIKYYPTLIGATKQKGTVDLEVGAFFTPNDVP